MDWATDFALAPRLPANRKRCNACSNPPVDVDYSNRIAMNDAVSAYNPGCNNPVLSTSYLHTDLPFSNAC